MDATHGALSTRDGQVVDGDVALDAVTDDALDDDGAALRPGDGHLRLAPRLVRLRVRRHCGRRRAVRQPETQARINSAHAHTPCVEQIACLIASATRD